MQRIRKLATLAPFLQLIFELSKLTSALLMPWTYTVIPAAGIPVLYTAAAAQPAASVGGRLPWAKRTVIVAVVLPTLFPLKKVSQVNTAWALPAFGSSAA